MKRITANKINVLNIAKRKKKPKQKPNRCLLPVLTCLTKFKMIDVVTV